jgi:hypothetical protein
LLSSVDVLLLLLQLLLLLLLLLVDTAGAASFWELEGLAVSGGGVKQPSAGLTGEVA